MSRSKAIVFGVSAAAVVAFTVAIIKLFVDTKEKTEERTAAANLIVYTHSSFMDVYGPGDELKAEFEKTCVCTVEYVDAGGATAALERIKLDPSRRVDVLLGLDHLLLSRIAQSVRLQELTPPQVEWLPEIRPFMYARFIPYDWSPMGLIYRNVEITPVNSWEEALKKLPPSTLSLQNPSLSTPGLQWLFGLFATSSGDEQFKNRLVGLKRVVHSYSPSWSAAYGLFKKKQAKVTFSYLTSLLYHWEVERDSSYQFMSFQEGHPVQIEYAAVPESCWNCAVAKRFVEFLVSPFAQEVLARKNYMLPVVKLPTAPWSEVQSRLPKVPVLGPEKLDEFISRQEDLLRMWSEAR